MTHAAPNVIMPTVRATCAGPACNGIPANDERVTDIILLGRAKMPAFQQKLTQQQVADLLAYLHTL